MKFFTFNRQSGDSMFVDAMPVSARTKNAKSQERPFKHVMSGSKLAEKTATELDRSQDDVAAVLSAFLAQVASALQRGNAVQIDGFGLFKPRRPKSGPCRNPRTGARVEPSGLRSVSFKPSLRLKTAVNAVL